MIEDEKVTYLANIYHLILADAKVDRVEEKAFEEISREIGAGYFERRQAIDLAKRDGYQLQLVGRWSRRIGNLEDMLFAAFCNGVVDRAEKSLIRECANRLGITQQQFDTIKQEAKRRYGEFK